MNPRVRAFLEEHHASPTYQHPTPTIHNQAKWNAYQTDVLLLLGLYEEIYQPSPDEGDCHSESAPDGSVRYYKRQPISVTQEEFRLLQSYSPIAYNE